VQWVQNLEGFISATTWDDLQEDFSEDEFKGCDCILAIDLGGKFDLLSYTLTFLKDDKYYVIPRFLLPENTIQKNAKYNKNFVAWTSAGLIRTCSGSVIDRNWLKEEISNDLEMFDVKCVVIDDYQSEDLTQWFQEEKGLDVIAVRTWVYAEISPLVAQFEKLIKSKKIVHDGNDLLKHCVISANLKHDNSGRVRPDKKNGKSKIDSLVCMIITQQAKEVLENVDDWIGIMF
jgi:phage terminase large subunit-like protein